MGLPLILLSACATVTKGTHETIKVITEPPGARAYTDIVKMPRDTQTAYIGCEPTPCSFKLPRRTEAVVLIEHKDYAPYEAAVFSDHRSERRYREKTRLKKQAAARQRDSRSPIAATTDAPVKSGTAVSLADPADIKDPLIRGNVALGTAASTGLIAGTAVLESGTVLVAPLAGGALIGGGMILFGAASYTLAADTTDAVTGADHSIYPNPLFVRLAKDRAQYTLDPNVDGVRQRRRKPSLKTPLAELPNSESNP
ncbi:hypothetical protein [Fretibacter rubidus]|uniref:hypothetical protein n=1 Tax=Fretibacter rubidus TaxID=570162 RepID=UPI00352A5825